jgi:hypothetical protein
MNGVAGYAGAIVNPVIAAAIESTRQALKEYIPDRWPQALQGKAPDQLDQPSNLLLWQPDVRSTVLEFEAVAGITFHATKAATATEEEKKDPRAQLMLCQPDSDGGASCSTLVTMTLPNKDVLIQQAGVVADAAKERLMPKSNDVATRDRLTEIAAQVVPPFAFWCAALPLHPDRMPRTIELIQLTLTLCSFAEQRFKHALAVPRPQYFNPKVMPAILTPGHGSLPSGHATEAFAVSTVLHRLLFGQAVSEEAKNAQKMLLALAARIANNRMVAGLHTPIDTSAGRMLGTVLARYLIARCVGGEATTGKFHGSELDAHGATLRRNGKPIPDNAPNAFGNELIEKNKDGKFDDSICSIEEGAEIQVARSDALAWLWDKARAEWGHPAETQ